MSLSANVNEKAALIWAIADKLTGVYKPHEYGEVILPLTVIRRFDCILADTKDAVLEKYEHVKNLPMKDILLRNVSGKAFYNTSKYTFERLLDDPDNIEANFRDYLNGFSENVLDILEKFRFDGQITMMANKGILYIVIKEFTSPYSCYVSTPVSLSAIAQIRAALSFTFALKLIVNLPMTCQVHSSACIICSKCARYLYTNTHFKNFCTDVKDYICHLLD